MGGHMEEFKSFYKEVSGSEGSRCGYNKRLDTYGRGCQHNCSYCYAKSLLDFRGLWDSEAPAVADPAKIERKIKNLPEGTVLRLGGMTDCFQPLERTQRVTLETIRLLNKYRIGYLIVTKSDLVADSDYMAAMDKDLAHIQITVTCLDDGLYREKHYENAPPPSKRIAAIWKLQDAGFDVAIRLSPLIPEYMDFEKLNGLGIEKAVVEFLRVNHWIEQWFDIDTSRYVLKEGNYRHLCLNDKKELLKRITIPSVTVCEDVALHYDYWKEHVNPDKDDCCNLRKPHAA